MHVSTNDLQRPHWPKRAIVTAGMPYGNKPLHFGHIGGVFVPADAFARFLRDRIGKANVRFISGTDCFGSPISEGFRKLVETEGFSGTVEDYVKHNHDLQKKTLESYDISLDIYEGSGLGYAGGVHELISQKFIEKLYENGYLEKRTTLQFFDVEAQSFLNGRQVSGFCPVPGCKSEHGYADECDLGHSYAPVDLIHPRSTLSGTVPEMRMVENWYFNLPVFAEFLRKRMKTLEEDPQVRSVVPKTMEEFLGPVLVYLKIETLARYHDLSSSLPPHIFHECEKGKQSYSLEFESVDARDVARGVLEDAGLRFRMGKALVPFRITGNISWGVPAPDLDQSRGLTVWCWPESLWAPMSFTMAVNDQQGMPRGSWRDWWCSHHAQVYQFIGQDNLYFYGIAQPALIEALRPGDILAPGTTDHPIRQTTLVANHHLLFGDKKASSSGDITPPSADELLDHYTVDQLRAHFLALGLDQKSVGFKPKPYLATPQERSDPRIADPVLKEGALLSHVFNRLARSCLYEAQKNYEGYLPLGMVSDTVREYVHQSMLEYEVIMYRIELHRIMSLMDTFIRWANKYWSDGIRSAELSSDTTLRTVILRDCFFLLRVATLLMHPIVPAGTEKIADYLDFEFEEFFSWNYDFDSNDELCSAGEVSEGRHRVRELAPRFDFFPKNALPTNSVQ